MKRSERHIYIYDYICTCLITLIQCMIINITNIVITVNINTIYTIAFVIKRGIKKNSNHNSYCCYTFSSSSSTWTVATITCRLLVSPNSSVSRKQLCPALWLLCWTRRFSLLLSESGNHNKGYIIYNTSVAKPYVTLSHKTSLKSAIDQS